MTKDAAYEIMQTWNSDEGRTTTMGPNGVIRFVQVMKFMKCFGIPYQRVLHLNRGQAETMLEKMVGIHSSRVLDVTLSMDT